MSKNIGDKQRALLQVVKKKGELTQEDVEKVFGYVSMAKSAMNSMISRGYIRQSGKVWIKGNKFREAFK